MRRISLGIISFLLSGCMGMPDNVHPVQGLEVDKYLGKWYEIARLDHSFERGLEQVSAEYSLRKDGGIKVQNRGFSVKKNTWKDAEGKAYFVGAEDEGYLRVSFFGPFYSSYIVFELDKERYQYAFISGAKKSYLWFLSRTPTVSDELMERFINKAMSLGFNTEQLIFVNQKGPASTPRP